MQIFPRGRSPGSILLVCISAHFVNDGLDVVLPLIMPLLVSRYELSLFEAGMVITSYSATTVVFQPLTGYFADLTGHRRVYLASGLVLMASGFYTIQFAPSFLWILFLSFCSGIGYSVYHPVAISLVNAAYMERRGFGVGFHGLGGSVGRGVFPTILGALLAAYGLGSALLFALVAGLSAGILVLSLPANVGVMKDRQFRVKLTSVVLAAAAVQLLRTVFYAGTVNFIPTYLVREVGLDIAAAGISTSIMLILGILSQPLGGYISDKVGRGSVLGISSFFMGFFYLLFLWAPYPASLVLLSLVGFWIFLGFPIPYAVAGDHVERESIGTALGMISGLGSAGGVIAPLFVGKLGDQFGLAGAMSVACAFAFGAAAVCLLLPRGPRKEEALQQ
ncbi:MAG: MFS transporter [Candidatus Bathyarchaeia archaeon]